MVPPSSISGDPPENSSNSEGSRRPDSEAWHIDDFQITLMDTPLEFLVAEHVRQRQAADMIELIADGNLNFHNLRELLEFLEGDFALHVADEEIVFFPFLRDQCEPEDKIDQLFDRLAEEHKNDEVMGDQVISTLKGLLCGEVLSSEDSELLREFSEMVRHHLALENAILLPIARVRLDKDSLDLIAEMLKERHNA